MNGSPGAPSTLLPEVLIIGGGVMGAATLYELARRGIRTHLIERGRFGMESTGKSAAIVRMHYSNPPVVRMALRSRQVLRHFEELVGGEPVYSATGWWFAVGPDDVETVRATADMNRSEGVEVLELDADQAEDVFPGIVTQGLGAVFVEPDSGFADPLATTLGFIRAAQSRGATAQEGVTAHRLITDNGSVTGVETNAGTFLAGAVVLAAGPWSGKLAATAGLAFPLSVTRECELYLDTPENLRPRASMSDLANRIYLRPMMASENHPGAMILGRGFPKQYDIVDPDSTFSAPTSGFEEDVRARLRERLPALAESRLVGGVSGFYAVTPDWHPYLGRASEFDNLILATGGSGHCFKLAPAIGEMVAADIAGDRVDYADIELFNLDRIAAKRFFAAAIGGNRA